MSSQSVKFTKTALEKIKPPKKPKGAKGGIYDTYRDTEEKGLVLIVSHGGAKTFYLLQKIQGNTRRIKLGPLSIGVETARKIAREHKGSIAQGKDPHQEKQKANKEYTLSIFFYQEYMERHAKPHKKTWDEDESYFIRHVEKPLGRRKLSSIVRKDIEKLHKSIGNQQGIYAANHVLRLLKTVFNKAILWDCCDHNPVRGVQQYKEKSRERFIMPDEIPAFFDALNNEPNEDVRDFFYLCLYTGARKSNVEAMRWNDISFELQTWTIPETKNGQSLIVNLLPEALEILNARKESTQSEWVFPSARSKTGHITDPKDAWKRIITRAGIKDLRIHDLRRTLGSYQAITGASTTIIGKSLGHKSHASTAIYARLHNDPVKASMELALGAIQKAAQIK